MKWKKCKYHGSFYYQVSHNLVNVGNLSLHAKLPLIHKLRTHLYDFCKKHQGRVVITHVRKFQTISIEQKNKNPYASLQ